jgi:hypothetical protein
MCFGHAGDAKTLQDVTVSFLAGGPEREGSFTPVER